MVNYLPVNEALGNMVTSLCVAGGRRARPKAETRLTRIACHLVYLYKASTRHTLTYSIKMLSHFLVSYPMTHNTK